MMSTETFWTKVGAYNEATWPIQVVMIVAAAVLTYRVFARPGLKTDAWMKAFLAFAFAWNGIVFFLVFTPMALVLKLLGKDAMRRKLDPQAESYRIDNKDATMGDM